MSFVERRNGAIVGVYANAQPGYAEEEVKDDDPEVIAFLKQKPKGESPISVEELLATAEKVGRLPTKDEVLAERGKPQPIVGI